MDLLNQIVRQFKNAPSDLITLEKLLSIRKLTPNELASLAIDFASNCFCEYRDALNPEIPSLTVENMHSNHIIDAIKLLLKFGLNPNTIVDEENVMWTTQYMDAPNVAPAVLQLLLENGGNPNHFIESENESLFECIDFKVSYDSYHYEYRHVVQCWLLLMAYGASRRKDAGKIPLKMIGNNSVDILKNYQMFDYAIELLPNQPGKYGCWKMHIFNIHTKEEIAVYY